MFHDSHDFFFNLDLDEGQEHLLSFANNPNEEGGTVANLGELEFPTELHLEWEAGIKTDEFSGDGSLGFFPKWAWPSLGDRAWANGDWIFDCGHPTTLTDPEPDESIYRSEIHPMRAIASMRQQLKPMPGSGATPVPVTATDLYIHGRSGMVTDVLDCGAEVIIGEGTCTTPFGDHDPVADHHPRPIDDDYHFDICLPPLPFDKAPLVTFFEPGPGNTIVGYDP